MIIEVTNEDETRQLGEKLGKSFRGGEVVELVGDVGAGKTSLTKGIAKGLGVNEDVLSPTFTISREYEARDGLKLAHYDFYRLSDPGIMSDELSETVGDKKTVTVVEWSDVVKNVLPDERIIVRLSSSSLTTRVLELEGRALEKVQLT